MPTSCQFSSALIRSRLFVVLMAGFSLSACQFSGDSSLKIPKAIFIIVDGIPADLIETTFTPHLDELAGTQGYTRSYVGGEIGGPSQSPTVSAVGYNSLLTGTWANKHNVYTNNIENPNYQYWDIFRIAKQHDPSLRTALFSTWLDNRTRLVGDGLSEAGGHKLDYYFDGFELDLDRFPHDESRTYIKDIDELVTDSAARYLLEQGPDLSWVYLEFTDDVGHMFGDGPELTKAVTLMDDNIGKIWSAVENRQDATNENWLVIVTTDHGRDVATGKSHGGQSARERITWIATNSQNLKERFSNTPAVVDILPSIVNHLKLTVPSKIADQLDGQPFID
jgi:predicted AlkP superfamily pyrophosphatase or phosphodiesterase